MCCTVPEPPQCEVQEISACIHRIQAEIFVDAGFGGLLDLGQVCGYVMRRMVVMSLVVARHASLVGVVGLVLAAVKQLESSLVHFY